LLIVSAVEAGMDAQKVQSFIQSNRGREQILTIYKFITEAIGINSIPTLIVNGNSVVNGAAGVNDVMETMRAAVKKGVSGKGLLPVIPSFE
jgi:predicted DsbA family dithiol-disulfide isomerase